VGSVLVSDINEGGQAGLGNRVVGAYPNLTGGETIYVFVGGAANGGTGGYNGGGNGVATNNENPSGGGGGATDIRYPSADLSDRLQVAGGGGGGGNAAYHFHSNTFTGGNGGNGGGSGNSLDGETGEDVVGDSGNIFPGGFGGTSTGPGAGADGCGSFLGQTGEAHSGAVGGAGGLGSSLMISGINYRASGCAGGGGYLGGNGGGGGSAGTIGCSGNNIGAGGGGSAGTNYFDGEPTNFENGVREGNGLVVVQYTIGSEPAALSIATTPCVGQETTLTFSPDGGTFTVLEGNISDVDSEGVFAPSAEGTYEIQYSYTDCGTNITTSATVTVNVECDLATIVTYDESVQVYPNPAESNVFVQSTQMLGQVIVTNAMGQVVLSLESNEKLLEIDIRHLDAGYYFIQTVDGVRSFIKK
jgi:hypothetical protein